MRGMTMNQSYTRTTKWNKKVNFQNHKDHRSISTSFQDWNRIDKDRNRFVKDVEKKTIYKYIWKAKHKTVQDSKKESIILSSVPWQTLLRKHFMNYFLNDVPKSNLYQEKIIKSDWHQHTPIYDHTGLCSVLNKRVRTSRTIMLQNFQEYW